MIWGVIEEREKSAYFFPQIPFTLARGLSSSYSPCQKESVNGACPLVFVFAFHRPAQGLVETGDKGVAVFGGEVGEPLGLDPEPEAFDGVEVGRVGGQVERFETPPVERLVLVPTGVVADQDLTLALGFEGSVGFVEKDLKDVPVRVGEFEQKLGGVGRLRNQESRKLVAFIAEAQTLLICLTGRT